MLLLPDGSHASYPEFAELADRVTGGDGLNWPGDPRLWLGVGVVEHHGKRGHRLEVWRHNEDGTDTILATWHPSEQYRVCYDLAQMRLDSPRHTSVLDRIDAHNADLEAKADEGVRAFMAEKVERLAYDLMRKQGHARNRFAVDGRRAR